MKSVRGFMLCGDTSNLESDPFSTLASNPEILISRPLCTFVSFGGREALRGQGLYLSDSPTHPQTPSSTAVGS